MKAAALSEDNAGPAGWDIALSKTSRACSHESMRPHAGVVSDRCRLLVPSHKVFRSLMHSLSCSLLGGTFSSRLLLRPSLGTLRGLRGGGGLPEWSRLLP